MLSQKKLVSLFKDFIDKTCLPFIRQNNTIFKEWLYFSTMLSQEYIDYGKIEKYVKELAVIDRERERVLNERNGNLLMGSASKKGGMTLGNFYKGEGEGERDREGKESWKVGSSSMDYGKVMGWKSDTGILKGIQGKDKERQREREKQRQKQKERQFQRDRQRQKEREQTLKKKQNYQQTHLDKQRKQIQTLLSQSHQRQRERQKQQSKKKPLSKLVSNLSTLYQSFSDNQRKIQKRLIPSPISTLDSISKFK